MPRRRSLTEEQLGSQLALQASVDQSCRKNQNTWGRHPIGQSHQLGTGPPAWVAPDNKASSRTCGNLFSMCSPCPEV